MRRELFKVGLIILVCMLLAVGLNLGERQSVNSAPMETSTWEPQHMEYLVQDRDTVETIVDRARMAGAMSGDLEEAKHDFWGVNTSIDSNIRSGQTVLIPFTKYGHPPWRDIRRSMEKSQPKSVNLADIYRD